MSVQNSADKKKKPKDQRRTMSMLEMFIINVNVC